MNRIVNGKQPEQGAKYDKTYVQKLKAYVPIEDIIQKDIPLHKIGKNMFGQCVFCGGRKSFSISIEKQFAHCFQCGKSMDVIGYIMAMKEVDFSDALLELKQYINQNHPQSLKKLMRAHACTNEMKAGVNPYHFSSAELEECLDSAETREVMSELHNMLGGMIEDYYFLTSEKIIQTERVSTAISLLKKMAAMSGKVNEESAEKLKNLCKYLIYVCDELKANDYHIGGLVLDLS